MQARLVVDIPARIDGSVRDDMELRGQPRCRSTGRVRVGAVDDFGSDLLGDGLCRRSPRDGRAEARGDTRCGADAVECDAGGDIQVLFRLDQLACRDYDEHANQQH